VVEGTEYCGPPVEGIDDSKAAQGKQFECGQSQKLPSWKTKIPAMLLSEQEAIEWVPHPLRPTNLRGLTILIVDAKGGFESSFDLDWF
jgi:hypothetical protein